MISWVFSYVNFFLILSVFLNFQTELMPFAKKNFCPKNKILRVEFIEIL